MGRDGSGVTVRETSIRLAFSAGGVAYRETLRIGGQVAAPTAANIKFAHRVMADIRAAIRAGTFDLAAFFPDSPRVERPAAETFGDAADAWLAAQAGAAAATRDQYRLALATWKQILGAQTPIASITHKDLVRKIGAYPWSSAKRHNNALIPLRAVFALEYAGPRAALNPVVGIANRKAVKPLPDPLTLAERDRILADMAERYDARVWAYFAWQFATGMRPEEAIALRWSDIDRASAVARVQRVKTFRGSERDGSKTHAGRDVDLVPLALQALKAMDPYTRAKGTDAPVFENPVTGRPWHDERSQRDHYWRPTLKRLGIRERRPYCTRHTWCTAALMAGIAPAYIAAQAGHSVQMLLSTYARWISGGDGGRERARLAQAIAGIALESPQKTTGQK